MPKYAYGVVYVVEADSPDAADEIMNPIGLDPRFEHVSGPYQWMDDMHEHVSAPVRYWRNGRPERLAMAYA